MSHCQHILVMHHFSAQPGWNKRWSEQSMATSKDSIWFKHSCAFHEGQTALWEGRVGRKKLLKATGHWQIFHHKPTQHREKTCNLWYNTARATWVRAAHAWPRLELFKEHEKIKERSNTAFIFQENWGDFAALLKCFEPEILSQIQLCRQEITALCSVPPAGW